MGAGARGRCVRSRRIGSIVATADSARLCACGVILSTRLSTGVHRPLKTPTGAPQSPVLHTFAAEIILRNTCLSCTACPHRCPPMIAAGTHSWSNRPATVLLLPAPDPHPGVRRRISRQRRNQLDRVPSTGLQWETVLPYFRRCRHRGRHSSCTGFSPWNFCSVGATPSSETHISAPQPAPQAHSRFS